MDPFLCQPEKFDVVLVEIGDWVVIIVEERICVSITIRHVNFGVIVKTGEFVQLQLI